LLPALLVFMQNDTGSALVFFALVLPLYREGLPGMVLFTGLTAALLFVLTLIMNEVYIISGLILLGFITFLYLSRNIKYTFYGLFLFGIILTLFGMLDYFSIIDAANYYIIFISLSVAMVVYLIFGYLKKITYIYKLLIFIYFAIVFTFTVNYVFNNFLEKHQQQRINILLGIESDPLGIGYNVNQSKIAIGSGGLSGKGFLQGTQTKFNFVPEQSTDFIFCTVGEEWGFIGSLIVIGLFLWLLLRLIILAERQKQQFSRVYGYCVISVFLFHVVINIGMTIGLVPVIGIPLPFFSYGGSSLWAFTLMLFIFLKLDANRLALL
ncbi:MAG: rod shape-determining protein RodA, partial [Bacteroidales bacterium]|nr:rod shape-determining protein RodA [Bacteroidales bacterium]